MVGPLGFILPVVNYQTQDISSGQGQNIVEKTTKNPHRPRFKRGEVRLAGYAHLGLNLRFESRKLEKGKNNQVVQDSPMNLIDFFPLFSFLCSNKAKIGKLAARKVVQIPSPAPVRCR
jgi:hypothetical protein